MQIVAEEFPPGRIEQQLANCLLCEHRCGVNRLAGEFGKCQAGPNARVFRHRVECGEELALIPSHLFYFSGCDLRCAFCIAEANAFDATRGRLFTAEFFTRAVAWGQSQGARNVQFVGGEPTIHLPAILSVLRQVEPLPPIVWKSDFYGTELAFELLLEVVDVFVADFKFGNNACAQRIAKISNYVEIVTRNLQYVQSRADLLVRHLLLPGHFDCCFAPMVEWLVREIPRVKLSLRDGYLPKWQAPHYDELRRPLAAKEGIRARQFAIERGMHVID